MTSERNKFLATWVSHSSLADFKKCPRSYFLKNVYKDPKTKRKIAIATGAMTLGTCVHGVLEPLANIKADKRREVDLLEKFESIWKEFDGKKGGFKSKEEENDFKQRGIMMLKRVQENFEPLSKKALRLKEELPWYYIDEENEIILCGKIDWMQYVEEDDSIHVLDFKTGKNTEDEDSFQLPIYLLLLNALQKRKVSGASYWYLESDDKPKEVTLPKVEEYKVRILDLARKVKQARADKTFLCPEGPGGCFRCRPFEDILAGKASYLGQGQYGQDLYMLD